MNEMYEHVSACVAEGWGRSATVCRQSVPHLLASSILSDDDADSEVMCFPTLDEGRKAKSKYEARSTTPSYDPLGRQALFYFC